MCQGSLNDSGIRSKLMNKQWSVNAMNVKRVPMKSAHRFNKNMNSDLFADEKYNSQLSTNPYSKTIPIDHQMKIED